MQKILFPMQYLNITQGYGVGTHVRSNAMDIAGLNGGIENFYAPFDGVIKKKWSTGNVVWLESLEPVEFADGTVDYATVMTVHDNDINDLRVGQVVPQGVPYYQEGTAGQATGNHVHVEIAKGKFTGTGWYENANGYWVLYNSVPPQNAFFLNNTIILNANNYNWKEAVTMEKVNISTLRIAHSELEGWDRNEVHSGKYDKLFQETWGHLTANEFIQVKWDQNGAYRDKLNEMATFWHKYGAIIAELESKAAMADKLSGELVQAKDTIVSRDNTILELNVKLAEKPKEIIKEVVKGDKDRTFGDLFGAAFKKLLNIK